MTRRIAGKATVSGHEVAYYVTQGLVQKYGADTPEIYSDLYDGGIAAADIWVGRLVAFLLEQQLYDSTMIVLTSDHGEELGDHDPTTFRGRHGDSAYEEMLRVPLVVKLPGSDHAGLRIDAVTRAIDVMPTVLEVAGVEGPRDRMQGTSLVGLWNGAREPGRTAFSEASAYAEEFKSVRDSRYKLIFQIGPDTVAQRGRSFVPSVPMRRFLFDLDVDPGETSNLLAGASSPRAERIAADLEKKLRSLAEPKPAEVEEVGLDVKTLERLRAMGYVR